MIRFDDSRERLISTTAMCLRAANTRRAKQIAAVIRARTS